MKTQFTATYLDSGFYTISPRAAGQLTRVLGQRMPKHGFEKFVMLETNGLKLNVWLSRTPTCRLSTPWKWALHGMRPDGHTLHNTPVTLGKSFKFLPIASTVAQTA